MQLLPLLIKGSTELNYSDVKLIVVPTDLFKELSQSIPSDDHKRLDSLNLIVHQSRFKNAEVILDTVTKHSEFMKSSFKL